MELMGKKEIIFKNPVKSIIGKNKELWWISARAFKREKDILNVL